MTALRQRLPREEDPAYLAYVRTLPCLICRRPGSDPAHLRTGSRQYEKPPTGMGEKPSDRWVLPLCRTHHDDQHRNNELEWWARQGIPDPFAVAQALYASRPNPRRPKLAKPFHDRPAKPRKPPEQRAKIPHCETKWGSRKIPSRPIQRKGERA